MRPPETPAGLVLQAATALGVPPGTCILVGDRAADVGAAAAAGASIQVASEATGDEGRAQARVIATNLAETVALIRSEV